MAIYLEGSDAITILVGKCRVEKKVCLFGEKEKAVSPYGLD